MKKRSRCIHLLFVICLFAAVLALFSACADNPVPGYTIGEDGYYHSNDPEAIAIILGNHANAMKIPDGAFEHIEKQLEKVVYGGYACLIIADSKPTKVDLNMSDSDMFQENAKNDKTLKDCLRDRPITLMEDIKAANAPGAEPEVDLLQAIREAVNALNSLAAKDIEKKQIIIVDTGISTSGSINFIEMDMISGRKDPAAIIEQIKKYEGGGLLPDLTGITVRFIGTSDGLAEVAYPQELEPTDKQYLRSFWTEVVTACGGEVADYDVAAGWDTPNEYTGEDDGTVSLYQHVSPVPFFHEPIFPPGPNNDDPTAQPNTPEPPPFEVPLDEKTLPFNGDEATYKNEKGAINQLRPIAKDIIDILERYPDEYIWLFGLTASIKIEEGNPQLSYDRAETVKNTLVELGVPSEKLLVVGMGAVFPGYDAKHLQENRKVLILSRTTEIFEEIMNWYDDGKLTEQTENWISKAIKKSGIER